MTVTGKPAPAGRWIDGLSVDMPLVDVVETVFRQRWEGVLYYLPATVENDAQNVEHVHKLRVSSRRLGAVLDVLARTFPQLPQKRLAGLAERIRRRCGKARDLDVRRAFLESLIPHVAVEDAGVIELLCEMTVERRERVQKKLRRKLPRLERKLQQAGAELLDALAESRRNGIPESSTFVQIGANLLLDEMAALWRRAEENVESPQTLHQLRIAGKQLRYTSEVFLPALPPAFRDEFYPQLEHVQDLLGTIHDAREASRELRRRRKRWQRRWKPGRRNRGGPSAFQWPELRSGLKVVLLAYAQQANQARTEYFDIWPDFAGPSFRLPVEQLLIGLADSPQSGNAS